MHGLFHCFETTPIASIQLVSFATKPKWIDFVWRQILLNTSFDLFLWQKREKGRMRVHKLNNVTTALKLLEQNRVSGLGECENILYWWIHYSFFLIDQSLINADPTTKWNLTPPFSIPLAAETSLVWFQMAIMLNDLVHMENTFTLQRPSCCGKGIQLYCTPILLSVNCSIAILYTCTASTLSGCENNLYKKTTKTEWK